MTFQSKLPWQIALRAVVLEGNAAFCLLDWILLSLFGHQEPLNTIQTSYQDNILQQHIHPLVLFNL